LLYFVIVFFFAGTQRPTFFDLVFFFVCFRQHREGEEEDEEEEDQQQDRQAPGRGCRDRTRSTAATAVSFSFFFFRQGLRSNPYQ
jgi:hypothetical protein